MGYRYRVISLQTTLKLICSNYITQTSQQWHKIQTYFTTKPTSLFEFEAKKLLYSDCPQNSRNWSLEEC